MRPYTAPDFTVRPAQNGYAVARVEYYIGRDGEKDQREVDVEWFPTYAEADSKRAALMAGARR